MRHRPIDLDRELSPEELTGSGRNPDFDTLVDDAEDASIQVICRKINPDFAKGNGEEEFIDVPLAKPSRAFYFGDRPLYLQECTRFEVAEQNEILCESEFPGNVSIFNELKVATRKGFVIPFVGAGMSTGAGLPDWTKYLVKCAQKAGLNGELIRERLQSGADYEDVMTEIVDRLSLEVFERDFDRDFRIQGDLDGAIMELPRLFDCPVITTNFDDVLETAYSQAGASFLDKRTGIDNLAKFHRAIPSGNRHLLKLHGSIGDPGSRILMKSEYERAYGPGEDVRLDWPIPRILKKVFSSYSLLFLGCRLSFDRTVTTFMRIAQVESVEHLPRHYAIMERPAVEAEYRKKDQELASASISPIWFPQGSYAKVAQILSLLKS